jgi:hypothetical protein
MLKSSEHIKCEKIENKEKQGRMHTKNSVWIYIKIGLKLVECG